MTKFKAEFPDGTKQFFPWGGVVDLPDGVDFRDVKITHVEVEDPPYRVDVSWHELIAC